MSRRLLGVLPAAGAGTRLGEIGGSKEALELRPGSGPVIGHALRHLVAAGVDEICVVLREGKDDLRRALADGEPWGCELDLRATAPTPSAVHTLCVALRDREPCDVLLAYPDILMDPSSAGRELVERYRATSCDAALALFPSSRPDKADMVEMDARGRPVELVIKDPSCRLSHTWGLAVWGARFTELLVECARSSAGVRELFVGDVVRRALERGDRFEGVRFDGGRLVDVGTPEDLERARGMHWD